MDPGTIRNSAGNSPLAAASQATALMRRGAVILFCLVASALVGSPTSAAPPWPIIFPEQRALDIRDPGQLPPARMLVVPPPPTVSNPNYDGPPHYLSLDQAIHLALQQTQVVRVLQGTTATTSGRTIYDAAITNTQIDQQNSKFDPTLQVNQGFNRVENPQAIVDPGNPNNSLITGTRNDNYNVSAGLAKLNPVGGTSQVTVNSNPTTLTPSFNSPLNPSNRSSAALSYTQPFLQGRGIGPNMASIVVARIETERSFFQFKDLLQEEVRGVTEAYWTLVSARTELWARQRQVEQAELAYKIADAKFKTEISNGADRAQALVTLAQFKAILVTAQGNVIQREAALRNIMRMPPSDSSLLIPTTPPTDLRYQPQWQALVNIAEERRPDLVELKLIIEADQQQLLLANNQALPKMDGVALYRWNGLEGDTPGGGHVSSGSGQWTDWTLGVNFSVPIGLRQSRAGLRQRELIIVRDQANLQQGLHNAIHLLAANVRSIDQLYEQYLANREARDAARLNLEQQFGQYRANRVIYLNVLQAITDWGNAINNEALALTQYNVQLANLERQSGTILETHGVRFYEERFGSIGPLGRLAQPVCYPHSQPPSENASRYPVSDEPAENKFNLEDPKKWRGRPLFLTPDQPNGEVKDVLPPERLPIPEPEPKPVAPPKAQAPGPGAKLDVRPVSAQAPATVSKKPLVPVQLRSVK